MASKAPLGSVNVDVGANLDRLVRDFAEAERASKAFEKSLGRGLGQTTGATTRQADQLAASEKRLAKSFDDAAKAADRFARSGRAAGEGAAEGARKADTSVQALRRTLLASASVIAAAFGANQIKNLADGYTRFTNQLKVADLEGGALVRTQEQLAETANKYGVELESLGNLYGRVAQAGDALGASQKDLIDLSNAVGAAQKIQGATTEQSRGAILQLTQALGSEIVRAEEFNSINEGLRPILQGVADASDKYAGSVAKLRRDVIDGKVASKDFFDLLLKSLPELEAKAEKANMTIGQSFVVLNNKLGEYIGKTDESWSATQRVGAAIAALANNLDTIIPILTTLIVAIGVRYVAALGAATRASIIAAGAQKGTAAAMGIVGAAAFAMQARMAGAATTAQALGFAAKGAGASLMAAFGGPVGVAILAVAGAVYYFWQRAEQARAEVETFNKRQKEAVEILELEAQRARTASGEIKALGGTTQTATGYVTAFAGATGDAANALYNQAKAAREARLEIIKTSIEAAKADRDAAKKTYDDLRPSKATTSRFGYIAETQEQMEARNRRDVAQDRLDKLEAALATAQKDPLTSYVSPNQKTGGRDLAGEIRNLQAELVNAQKAKNDTASKMLLDEIKLRQRIIELMKTGLSMETAQATAQAEKIKAPPKPSSSNNRGESVRFGDPAPGARQASDFGMRTDPITGKQKFHAGIDLAGGGGQIKAPANGVIIRTGKNGGYGNVVWIDHGNGVISELNHLASSSVKVGDSVAKGQDVGVMGSTGRSTGKHLHWNVRTGAGKDGRGGDYVDPTKGPFTVDPGAAAANAEELIAEQADNFGQKLQEYNDAILQSRQSQEADAAKVADFERQRVNDERDRAKAEIEAKTATGTYDDAQAAILIAKNEELRAAQLGAINAAEHQRIAEETARIAEQQHDRMIEALQAQADIARTASERRAIERRILDAQKEYERKVLEAIIASPFTTPIDRALAEQDKASLDSRYGDKRAAIDESTRKDLRETAPAGSESAHTDALDRIAEEEQAKIDIVREALEAKVILEEEAAARIEEIEAEKHDRILELETARKSVLIQAAQSTADSLMQIAGDLAGKQSAAYKAMFIVSKAFAIADSVIKIQQAIASAAMSLPFPANLPAIATVAALGAGIISNIVAVSAQFKSGGFTGYGNDNDPAGTVHRNEYVMDAKTVRRVGRNKLDSIRAGRDPTSGFSRMAADRPDGMMGGGARPLNVTVQNNAPGVRHEVRQGLTRDDVVIIAREEAPKAVAADLGRPNSKTRKAVQRHTTARGRKS